MKQSNFTAVVRTAIGGGFVACSLLSFAQPAPNGQTSVGTKSVVASVSTVALATKLSKNGLYADPKELAALHALDGASQRKIANSLVAASNRATSQDILATQLVVDDTLRSINIQALQKQLESGALNPALRHELGLSRGLANTPASTSALREKDRELGDWSRSTGALLRRNDPARIGREMPVTVTLLPPSKNSGLCGGTRCAITLPGTPAPHLPGDVIGSSDRIPSDKNMLTPGRSPKNFNPLGFMEVVFFKGPLGRCSGTMISTAVLLTAAHCLQGARSSDVVHPADVQVWLPKINPEKLTSCVAALRDGNGYQRCVDFQPASVDSISVHPAFDRGKLANDIAYIRLRDPPTSVEPARVTFVDTSKVITLAGYGETLLPTNAREPSAWALEVGWHSGASVDMFDGKITWLSAKGDRQSSTCEGDSGGPIYAGDFTGSEASSAHSVFAIVSAGKSSSCVDHVVQQTKLSHPPVRAWLCTNLADAIEGCSAKKLAMIDPS